MFEETNEETGIFKVPLPSTSRGRTRETQELIDRASDRHRNNVPLVSAESDEEAYKLGLQADLIKNGEACIVVNSGVKGVDLELANKTIESLKEVFPNMTVDHSAVKLKNPASMPDSVIAMINLKINNN
jgi:hypothetical protein